MLENLILSLRVFKNIIISPLELFQNIFDDSSKYRFSVWLLYVASGMVPFLKSFQKERQVIDFFSNEKLNSLMSIYSMPQIQLIVVFVCFLLFVFLVNFFGRFIGKKSNSDSLAICILSISGIGILIQLSFLIFKQFLSHKALTILWFLAFAWVAFLSVVAIKKCYTYTYVESIIVYIASGLPVILFAGLMGIAPFLLWATS